MKHGNPHRTSSLLQLTLQDYNNKYILLPDIIIIVSSSPSSLLSSRVLYNAAFTLTRCAVVYIYIYIIIMLLGIINKNDRCVGVHTLNN